METLRLDLIPELANAVIDMEDIAYREGLGPETEERVKLWEALVIISEIITGRTALSNNR